MEPNDEMIIDEEVMVQDIEDIGKRIIMNSNGNDKETLFQEDAIDIDRNENEDEENDEDINHDNNNHHLIKKEQIVKEEKEDEDDECFNENNNDDQIMINKLQQKEQSHKKEKNNLMRFPLAKIKNTIRLDDDIKLCQKNAYYVIGKMTELFLQELAKNSHSICKMAKRKTLNIDDINTAIKGKDKYSFIDIVSIFHIDVIGTSVAKEKKMKKNIKQLSLTPESDVLMISPSLPKANSNANINKSNQQKKKKIKTTQKEPISNKKIDQMFSK